MNHIPTDLEIIEDIYFRYYDSFKRYATDEPDRIARIRVPINIQEVADACNVPEDMVFGRMFYHFNKKYSYKDEKGRITTFFVTDKFEGLSVNFPLVASVLADLRQEKKQTDVLIALASSSMGLSIIAILMAYFL